MLTRLSAIRPVLLGIEDLHWADQSTLDLTAFLVRSLREARVLLLATYRSDELHRRHRLRPLLTGWERIRLIEHMELRRFDRDEVAAQLTAILGAAPAPGVVEAVFDRSGGNAYLVEELAEALRGGGDLLSLSPSLKHVLLSRVDALGPGAQRLLRTASVAGRAVPERLLAEVAGIGDSEFFAGLREAVENHLLLVDPQGRRVRVRAYRCANQGRGEWQDSTSRRAGAAARPSARAHDPALAGEAAAAVSSALAYHWYEALDLPRALPAVIDAASHAMASATHRRRHCANWSALSRSGRACRTRGSARPGRGRGGRLAAEAAYQCGDLDRSKSLSADVAGLRSSFDPIRRALLLERVRDGPAGLGLVRGSGGHAAGGAGPAVRRPGQSAHAVVLAALANALMRMSEWQEGAQVARRAVAVADRGAEDVKADVTITLGSAMCYLGPAGSATSRRCAPGWRWPWSSASRATAVRGSSTCRVLELLGRHRDAALTAGEGFSSRRGPGSRSLGPFLVGSSGPSRCLRWVRAEVDEITARALRTPGGVRR